MTRHFLDIADFSSEQIRSIVDKAEAYKTGQCKEKPLQDKAVGLLFEKPSLRTRASFEVGIHQLGGSPVSFQRQEVGLGEREAIKDVARVLSRYVDAIVIRTFSHEKLKELADYATVPVINGLTDYSHPCQAIADALTIKEQFGEFKGLKSVYLGDSNNVTRSLSEVCDALAVESVISTPHDDGCDYATLIQDPKVAVKGADILYTDTWVSMGEEEMGKSLAVFEPYQVNAELLSQANDNAIVLHCLPAHRGEEITDEVMESAQSRVFDQAENRLHAQKAILDFCVRG